jgi:hypothetical protein
LKRVASRRGTGWDNPRASIGQVIRKAACHFDEFVFIPNVITTGLKVGGLLYPWQPAGMLVHKDEQMWALPVFYYERKTRA